MNTQDLEKKLVHLAEYKIKDTMLNLIFDMADCPENKTGYPVPKDIISIKEDINKAYCSLDDILDTEKREDFEKTLGSLLKRIIEKGIAVNRYISANDQLGEKLLLAFKKNDIKNIDASISLNNSAMIDIIRGYVSTLQDNIEGQYAMSELISKLPLRMTKERYNDYVTKGVELIGQGFSRAFAASCVGRLKDIFYADCSDGLKTDFPLISEKLSITLNTIENLDKEGITEALEDIDNNVENIQNIYALLGIMFNDVVYMQILSMFVIDKEFLFGDDMLLKDLFYAVADAIKSDDNSLFEEIAERAENEIADRFDNAKPVEAEIDKELKDITQEDYEALSPETKTAINVNNTISEMFDSELDQSIMLSMGTDDEAADLTADLLSYIDEKTSDMNNADKKLVKQSFLKNLPCTMTKEELCNYCAYALDGIRDRDISLITYGEIFTITDRAKDAHEHDHDCGCGHEHHHDHDCNCGHEHHHNHDCGCGHEHHHDHDCGCGHHHH